MAVGCMWKRRPPAAGFASASGAVTAGASPAFRFADLIGARNLRRVFSLNPADASGGFFFSARRADRTQHRFARPAIDLQSRRFLVRPERRACLHPGLAVEFVLVETDARQVTLQGFDIAATQLGRPLPLRNARLRPPTLVSCVPRDEQRPDPRII